MTVHDRQRFQRAYNALAIATRLPADQAGKDALAVFWRGLEVFPVEAVETAAERLATTSEWFPKLVEWREAAGDAQRQQALALQIPPAARDWTVECPACDDTGWSLLPCDGTVAAGGLATCGRCRVHGVHEFVVSCPCRPNNRTYQRRRVEAQPVAR